MAALQESTDKLEMDRNALQDQLQLVQQKLPALQQVRRFRMHQHTTVHTKHMETAATVPGVYRQGSF